MVVGLIVIILAGLALVVVGYLGLTSKLAPNHFAGIRTRFTRASESNWYAAQRAGAPWMIFGGVAAMMAGLAFLPFVIAGKLSTGPALAINIVLLAIIVISAIGAWVFGQWGARHDVLGPGFPKQ
jgi:uncharacterized membrane protein